MEQYCAHHYTYNPPLSGATLSFFGMGIPSNCGLGLIYNIHYSFPLEALLKNPILIQNKILWPKLQQKKLHRFLDQYIYNDFCNFVDHLHKLYNKRVQHHGNDQGFLDQLHPLILLDSSNPRPMPIWMFTRLLFTGRNNKCYNFRCQLDHQITKISIQLASLSQKLSASKTSSEALTLENLVLLIENNKQRYDRPPILLHISDGTTGFCTALALPDSESVTNRNSGNDITQWYLDLNVPFVRKLKNES